MPEPLTMSPITSSLAALVATQRFAANGERRWQEEANCLGVDPDLFFPERGASTREAKSVCRSCEVRVDCLEYAARPRREVRYLGWAVGAGTPPGPPSARARAPHRDGRLTQAVALATREAGLDRLVGSDP